MARGEGTGKGCVMETILIVEDDKNQRLLYEKEFTHEGYAVISAVDGRDAMEKVKKSNLDLVILDIRMPGMDGIEALGRILAADRKIPVILNTAYTSYKENFMTWAADAYIVKSSDLTPLKNTVRNLLAKRRKDVATAKI